MAIAVTQTWIFTGSFCRLNFNFSMLPSVPSSELGSVLCAPAMPFPLSVAVLSFYHDLHSSEKCLPFILQTVPLIRVYYILVIIGMVRRFARDAITEHTGLSNKHVLSPSSKTDVQCRGDFVGGLSSPRVLLHTAPSWWYMALRLYPSAMQLKTTFKNNLPISVRTCTQDKL